MREQLQWVDSLVPKTLSFHGQHKNGHRPTTMKVSLGDYYLHITNDNSKILDYAFPQLISARHSNCQNTLCSPYFGACHLDTQQVIAGCEGDSVHVARHGYFNAVWL